MDAQGGPGQDPCGAAHPRSPRNRDDLWLDRHFLLLQIPLVVFLWWLGSVTGAGGLALVLWGFPLRLVIAYPFTWRVNSATHRWGCIGYPSGDHSRNTWLVALVTFGEGWHNNHHAFSSSVRMGFRWWELDPPWWPIVALRRRGLVRHVRLAPVLQPPRLRHRSS
nr:fatty acid desaturase [Cyanobium sp. Morenito 9A2]